MDEESVSKAENFLQKYITPFRVVYRGDFINP